VAFSFRFIAAKTTSQSMRLCPGAQTCQMWVTAAMRKVPEIAVPTCLHGNWHSSRSEIRSILVEVALLREFWIRNLPLSSFAAFIITLHFTEELYIHIIVSHGLPLQLYITGSSTLRTQHTTRSFFSVILFAKLRIFCLTYTNDVYGAAYTQFLITHEWLSFSAVASVIHLF
jgi:hypothetical protein